MTGLLALVVVGQSYYAQPVYQQQAYPQAYVEKIVYVAIENPQEYFAGVIGQQQRAAARQAEAQQTQTTTDQKIDQLTRLVQDLQKQMETRQNDALLPPKPALAPQPGLPATSFPAASEAAPPPPTIRSASIRPAGNMGVPTHGGVAILAQHCAKCHTGPRAAGDLAIFDRPGQLARLDEVALSGMRDALLAGTMPKGKGHLTLREFAAINDFVNQQTGNLAANPNPRKKTR